MSFMEYNIANHLRIYLSFPPAQDNEMGTSDANATAQPRYVMRSYLHVQETAEKWGASVRWVNQYILILNCF